jgi:aquaporin Z
VNPARSTGVAIYVGGGPIAQLWLFSLAPLVGGALGETVYKALFTSPTETAVARARA